MRRLCERASLVVSASQDSNYCQRIFLEGFRRAHLSISSRMTSTTSSGRRAMFLWPRSMVMPGGCCCCSSRGASGRWTMSWREWSMAAFARATTSSSEMGTGASLLMTSGGQWVGRRRRGAQTCSCSGGEHVQRCSGSQCSNSERGKELSGAWTSTGKRRGPWSTTNHKVQTTASL